MQMGAKRVIGKVLDSKTLRQARNKPRVTPGPSLPSSPPWSGVPLLKFLGGLAPASTQGKYVATQSKCEKELPS